MNKIKKISFSIALLLVVKSSLSAPVETCDSIPADHAKLVRCAAISADDWTRQKATAKEIFDVAVEEAETTEDPDRLRAIVADLLGHMVYLEAKQEAK